MTKRAAYHKYRDGNAGTRHRFRVETLQQPRFGPRTRGETLRRSSTSVREIAEHFWGIKGKLVAADS